MTHAEITVDAVGRGALTIAGIDLSKEASGFTLRCEAGRQTELHIDLTPRAVTAAADVDVVISEALRALLVELGWTPPASAPTNQHKES